MNSASKSKNNSPTDAAKKLATDYLQIASGELKPSQKVTDATLAAREVLSSEWSVLFSGLRSTGKSSLVSTLWGNSELLPTAVRDCTQTNTRIRVPNEDEHNQQMILNFLSKDEAIEYALNGLDFHRLREVLRQVIGPSFKDMSSHEKLRYTSTRVRELFTEREDIHILYEPTTEQLETIELFLEFIESEDFFPGGQINKDWSERREYLMGRRRRDGRTLEVAKLLTLKLVELICATDSWGENAPRLIDSPWIPTFHNARRAELILREAENIDALVILSLPEPFELEDWTKRIFEMRPELSARTVLVYNQVDTIDTSALFGREGFCEFWNDNLRTLNKAGIQTENVLITSARLPFLEGLPEDISHVGHGATPREMIPPLLTRLSKIKALVESENRGDDFSRKMIAACAPEDAGIGLLRQRLLGFSTCEIPASRAIQFASSILDIADAKFEKHKAQALAISTELKAAHNSTQNNAEGINPTMPDGRSLFVE